MIKENKKLKDFKLPSTNGKNFQLKKELKKKPNHIHISKR